MSKYKKIEIISVIALAMFIVCSAMIITAYNRSVYKHSYNNWNKLKDVTEFEAVLIYDEIATDFCKVSRQEFEGSGYELTSENIEALGKLQSVYKIFLVVGIVSFIVIIFGAKALYRRRRFAWIVNGGVLAILLTSIQVIYFTISNNPMILAIKDMIFYKNYTPYFNNEDILLKIIPDSFARNIALLYLIVVVALVSIAILIRLLIIYRGRPHKF